MLSPGTMRFKISVEGVSAHNNLSNFDQNNLYLVRLGYITVVKTVKINPLNFTIYVPDPQKVGLSFTEFKRSLREQVNKSVQV